MSFDQSTRNRLQRFVNSSREILREEFTRQLQAIYGLDPKQGTIADIANLGNLDNRQRQTAQLLRDTLTHYLATTPGKNEKERVKQVLDRIVREQSFTVLNRLAALRMAEARGFLLESIGNQYNSKGFKLYRQLSGTSHGETGDAYRNYLMSLFDEFSLDLAVLFDRHSPQGRLFPRESALIALLNEVNHHEVDHLWAEDETIGWIYQYFNSQEERQQMRAESQAPRNSRELAVRNQFFTPRYVVEFLTDNTLGRIWYEMTQGSTALVEDCRYLVRRPTEIFLQPNESVPQTEVTETATEPLTQEQLLSQPIYIPYRAVKDPRNIRMLDPACGSMHFGLYAFDLFERIYLEAWQYEQQYGAESLEREADQLPLQATFESFEVFKQQIPKLIIEHNIHGVDIDPRAVQIAGLSLWQRAQRAWHEQKIKPNQRPTISKSNIVCAEPMPGEKALLQEFTSQLYPPVLGQLVEVIFDKMQLVGEAGTLLKIEEEIQNAIHKAREQWVSETAAGTSADMFQAELDAATAQIKLGFDLSGIDDERFWDDAEEQILQALSDYAQQAESNAEQKRLFAEDAAKGFGFIDLCRKRFDIVLMNPPFGEFSEKFKSIASKLYSSGSHDILTAFVEEGDVLLNRDGFLGAITSRTCFYAISTRTWRERVIQNRWVTIWSDLGQGVLDDAMVETAAYILKKSNQKDLSVFLDCSKVDILEAKRAIYLKENLVDGVYLKYQKDFDVIEGSPFSYWTSHNLLNSLRKMNPLSSQGITVKVGLQTGDDFRFIRCWWEVPNNYHYWIPHAKGGENSPFLSDIHLLVNWKQRGREICSQSSVRLNAYTTINPSDGLSKGLTFPYRTHRFSPSVLPKNTITGVAGMGVYSNSKNLYEVLGVLNSSIFNKLIDMRLGLKEINALYQAGTINPIAYPELNEEDSSFIQHNVREILESNLYIFAENECSRFFKKPNINQSIKSFLEIANEKNIQWEGIKSKLKHLYTKIDNKLSKIYHLDSNEFKSISEEGEKLFLQSYPNDFTNTENEEYKAISFIVGNFFGRWANYNDEIINTVDDLWSDEYLIKPVKCTDVELPSICDVDILSSYVINNLSNRDIQYNFGEIYLYLNQPLKFFAKHLTNYSRSRRSAPIYWQLQTPSGSYTLWLYYHRLTEQTLYTCVNDFVEPKLHQVEQDIHALTSKTPRSKQEEKELETLASLASELRDFRDELLRIAKFWKPNLNDGVQITAAPLWKLFQHRTWQKKLKDTWTSLEQGDYDWSHLACSIWPDRVLRKCHQDRSFAIAHDVEDYFWQQVEVPIKRGNRLTGEVKIEWQTKDLDETGLSTLIKHIKDEKQL